MQVDVGDFLRFTSCVLYTELDNPDQPLINVEVVAHVTRPEIRSSEVKYPVYVNIVRSHIGWKGERSIPYKGVETSP